MTRSYKLRKVVGTFRSYATFKGMKWQLLNERPGCSKMTFERLECGHYKKLEPALNRVEAIRRLLGATRRCYECGEPALKRIRAGLYETVIGGKKIVVEHCTPAKGFMFDEWHYGPEDDPHCDQCSTLKEVKEALKVYKTK